MKNLLFYFFILKLRCKTTPYVTFLLVDFKYILNLGVKLRIFFAKPFTYVFMYGRIKREWVCIKMTVRCVKASGGHFLYD